MGRACSEKSQAQGKKHSNPQPENDNYKKIKAMQPQNLWENWNLYYLIIYTKILYIKFYMCYSASCFYLKNKILFNFIK